MITLDDWQPIETAPKQEGLRIIGWCEDIGEIVTLDYQAACKDNENDYEESWYQASNSERATDFFPTHWMPLPKPPGAQ